jgi:NAD-dependent deacetylase
VTQNIDLLHERAGSRDVVEVHGSIRTSTCPRCGQRYLLEDVLRMIEAASSRSSGGAGGAGPEGIVLRTDPEGTVPPAASGGGEAGLRPAGAAAGEGRETGDGAPRCEDDGAVLKPDVVFFGELLPEAAIDRATALAREARLLLVVGSALEVYPVAGLPLETLGAGGKLAIVNLGPTEFDGRADLRMAAPAGEALAAVVEALD